MALGVETTEQYALNDCKLLFYILKFPIELNWLILIGTL